MPRCPRLPPALHGWWPFPDGNPGAGAWEPLECRPLVVTASVVSLPLFSRCSFQSVDLVFIDPSPGPTSWQNLLLLLF